jgi:hypothetical protein
MSPRAWSPGCQALAQAGQQDRPLAGDRDDGSGREVLPIQPVPHGAPDLLRVDDAVADEPRECPADALDRPGGDHSGHVARGEGRLGTGEHREDVAVHGGRDHGERMLQEHGTPPG